MKLVLCLSKFKYQKYVKEFESKQLTEEQISANHEAIEKFRRENRIDNVMFKRVKYVIRVPYPVPTFETFLKSKLGNTGLDVDDIEIRIKI